MATMKAAAAVALVATVVMALAACSAADLFIHFKDTDKVSVFSTNPRPKIVVGEWFGDGQVFDYAVTTSAGSEGTLVARAQGLFYRSSKASAFRAEKEEFTVLFVDSDGQYTGTSFSFSGVWVSDSVHEFPILGGTGGLVGLKGTVTFTGVGSGVYRLDLAAASPRFQSFLASSAYSQLV